MPVSRKLTPEEEDEIRRRILAHESYRSIGEDLGLTRNAIWARANKWGITNGLRPGMPGIPRAVRTEHLDRIRELGTQGRTIQEIADEVGLAWTSVQYIVRKHNIPYLRSRSQQPVTIFKDRILSGDPESLFADLSFITENFPNMVRHPRRRRHRSMAKVAEEGEA